MSFFRVFGRTQALHSFKTTLQLHSSTSRNSLQIIAPRYSLFSVGNNGRWKVSSFGCGSLMPRCEFRSVVDSNIPFSNLGRHSTARSCSMLNFQHQYATKAAYTEKKSKKMLLYLTGLVFAMVGCSYAAVPLYRRFCQATGYGGTVQRKESVEEKIARHAIDGTVSTREIVVQFNADVADGMPWKFIPTQREVRVKPGESALAFYTAENRSSTPITGVSTYNVTPMKAAVYFNKIQCFCFEEQRLLPGEQIDMPVFFYIDPEFETDPKMDGINNIILSYTFFKVSDE
ncbi:PREDICTED: cytochrome c oxidase assembly protein COX11, mitochondrial [Ipomoea nil]|uniref:cytochrome c oxidase assembly protein COX11, mitochondrial n=1 Tax=Ipomoea nil TaxID=35883 RepID=UPI000901B26F|nr:PREDICTED: cytochrome c oxidase assembly protein COX11, mitochondrial [Ipomoea nil]XP_019182741.1 PREDICTED: cytochrome c oxidase assembly protein COX11, mitochondrial [Ipomoea nil]